MTETAGQDTLYQAPYFEFSRQEFSANMGTILREIIPDEFNVGGEDSRGDLWFRFFQLPDDSTERSKRIWEIARAGSDRTNGDHVGKFDSLYIRAAREAGVDPMDIIDCMTAADVFRRAAKDALETVTQIFHGNALLIYDGKTDKGLRHVSFPEFTFKNLASRNEALLAIIGLK